MTTNVELQNQKGNEFQDLEVTKSVSEPIKEEAPVVKARTPPERNKFEIEAFQNEIFGSHSQYVEDLLTRNTSFVFTKPEVGNEFNIAQSFIENQDSTYDPYLNREAVKQDNLALFQAQDVSPESLESMAVKQDSEEVKGELQIISERLAARYKDENLSPEQVDDLNMILNRINTVQQRRMVSEYIEMQSSELMKNESFMTLANDAVEFLIDAVGASERVQQQNMLSSISGKEVPLRFFRSDMLEDALTEIEELPKSKQLDILQKTIPLALEQEGLLGNKNALISMDVLQQANDYLSYRESGSDDWVSFLDALGAAGVVFSTGRVFKSFMRALSTQAMAARASTWNMANTYNLVEKNAEAIENFNKAIKSLSPYSPQAEKITFTENTIPVQKEVSVRGKKQEINTQIKAEEDEVKRLKRELNSITGAKAEFEEASARSKANKTPFKKENVKVKNEFKKRREELKNVIIQKEDSIKALREGKKTLKPSKVKSGEVGTYSSLRITSGRGINVISSYSPGTVKSLMGKSYSNPELLTTNTIKLGDTPDDVIVGVSPKIPGDTQEGVNPNLIIPDTSTEKVADRRIGDLLSESETQNVANTLAKAATRLTGKGSLLRPDMTEIIETDSNTIKIRGYVGSDNDGEGFSSFEDAKFAKDALIGENTTIVAKLPNGNDFVQVNGNIQGNPEYFVQVEKKGRFTPNDATDYQDSSTWGTANVLFDGFFSPKDKIDNNIPNTLSYLNTNIGIYNTKKLFSILKPYMDLGSLKDKVKGDWSIKDRVDSILVKGDAEQKDYSLEEFRVLYGDENITEESKAWKAYQGVNRFYKEVWYIRNDIKREEWNRKGYKSLGVKRPSDDTVDLLGKPLERSEGLSDLSKEGYTKIYDLRNTESPRTINVDTLDKDDSAWVIVKLSHKADFENGSIHRYAVVDKYGVKDLPAAVTPKRSGHVDLDYENIGAKIVIKTTQEVGGKLEPVYRVVRLADSRKEAEEWLDTPIGNTTRRERIQNIYKVEVEAQDSAETASELDLIDIDANKNFTPRNLKGRQKKALRMLDGSTSIRSMPERLAGTLGSVSNAYNKDAFQIMKNRWTNTFNDLRDEKADRAFPTKESDIKFSSRADESRKRDAMNIHRYIVQTERMFGFNIDRNSGMNKAVTIKRFGKEFKLSGNNALDTVTQMLRWSVVYGNPVYQAIGNTLTASDIFKVHPTEGPASFIETLNLLAYYRGKKLSGSKKYDSNVAAILTGFKDGKDLNDFIDSIPSSGAVTSMYVDDILADTDSIRGMMGSRILKGAKSFVTATTDLTNLVAYRQAVKDVRKKFPDLNPYSGKGKVEVNKIRTGYTHSMDRSDAFVQETTSVGRLFFGLTTHVAKGFKNTIVRPAYRASIGAGAEGVVKAGPYLGMTQEGVATAKKFRRLGKEGSVYDETVLGALTVLGTTVAWFGIDGVVPTNWSRNWNITDEIHSLTGNKSADSIISEGIVDLTIRAGYGIDPDIAEKFAYSDYLSFLKGLTGLDGATVNVLGSGTILWDRGQKLFNIARMTFNPLSEEALKLNEGDILNFTSYLGNKALNTAISGFNSWERYQMAEAFGVYMSSTGTPLYNIPDSATGVLLAGIRPEGMTTIESLNPAMERMRRLGDAGQDYYRNKLPKMFREYTYYQWRNIIEDKGELSYEDMFEAIERSARILNVQLDHMGADARRGEIITEFLNSVIDAAENPKDKFRAETEDRVWKQVESISRSGDTAKSALSKLEAIHSVQENPEIRRRIEITMDAFKTEIEHNKKLSEEE